MDLTAHAAVFDRAAPTYDRVGVDFFSVFGAVLVDAVDLRPGERVLDIGCGRGAVLTPAAAAVTSTGRAVGVDLAPTMVALTAEELADRPWVTVHQADAAALPEYLGAFDAVLSSLVLFFCDDPAAVLRGWARHVAPDGRLGLVTFLEDPAADWYRDLVGRYLPEDSGDPGAAGGDDGDDSDEPTPFDLVGDPEWLDGALTDAGLGRQVATVTRHAVRFADVDRWWAWVWSHGGRAALEAVDPARHDALKTEAADLLDANRLDDGSLGVHVTTRLTIARR